MNRGRRPSDAISTHRFKWMRMRLELGAPSKLGLGGCWRRINSDLSQKRGRRKQPVDLVLAQFFVSCHSEVAQPPRTLRLLGCVLRNHIVLTGRLSSCLPSPPPLTAYSPAPAHSARVGHPPAGRCSPAAAPRVLSPSAHARNPRLHPAPPSQPQS